MKIKRFTEQDGGYSGQLSFYCHGCKELHWVNDDETKGNPDRVWGFNKDFEKPTITPSVLVTWPNNRCHSFVRNGNIEYLGDCTHELAGKIVPLIDIEDEML